MSLRILLILLILIEIILHGDFIEIPFNAHFRPIIIAIIGLAIGWVGISQSKSRSSINKEFGIPLIKYVLPAFILFASIVLFRHLNDIFTASPIQLAESDIIPTIQELVRRFLEGDPVYVPVDHGTWQVIPGYLPMQWMPFSVASLLDFDFRWIPYIVLGSAISILAFRSYRNDRGYESLLLIVAFISLLLYTLQDAQSKMYLTTIEWMMASFYILLCAFIDSKKFWVIGIILFLCCFSRYSLLFWLLPLAVVYYYENAFKFNLSVAGTFLLLGLAFYVIPFLFSNHSSFTEGIAYYTVATEHIWASERITPGHLDKGYGFAYYFWHYLSDWPVVDQVKTCINTHRLVSISAAVVLTLYYIKERANIVHLSLFLIAALKIYFVFFYGFIQIPYLYLMTIPCMVSIMMLYQHKEKTINF